MMHIIYMHTIMMHNVSFVVCGFITHNIHVYTLYKAVNNINSYYIYVHAGAGYVINIIEAGVDK